MAGTRADRRFSNGLHRLQRTGLGFPDIVSRLRFEVP